MYEQGGLNQVFNAAITPHAQEWTRWESNPVLFFSREITNPNSVHTLCRLNKLAKHGYVYAEQITVFFRFNP